MIFASYNNITSPLGFDTKQNYDAVCQSKIGVKQQHLPFSKDVFCIAKIESEKIADIFKTFGNATKHTKLEQLSIISIQDVIAQSGINPQDEKLLLIYSTTKGNIDILENTYKNIDNKRVYLSTFANHLQTHFNFKNQPVVLSNACISGVLAIIMAQRFIESGQYNSVLVCGGDIVSEFTISGFKSFNALSNLPSKPFDADRVGINLGEAVSTLLISNQSEFSKPYNAIIKTGASANDANHISGPSRTGDGLYLCLQQVLASNPQDLGFISAHGTATPFNDEMESIAFDRASLHTIPVNSLKGYYGHTLGAAGVLETVLSLESLKHQHLIKSEGYQNKGVSGNICMIDKHQAATFTSFIKTASGFGGCNAAALFQLAT
jgi:3-oxoacyl-[acyl-carrier-protein] synthase I